MNIAGIELQRVQRDIVDTVSEEYKTRLAEDVIVRFVREPSEFFENFYRIDAWDNRELPPRGLLGRSARIEGLFRDAHDFHQTIVDVYSPGFIGRTIAKIRHCDPMGTVRIRRYSEPYGTIDT